MPLLKPSRYTLSVSDFGPRVPPQRHFRASIDGDRAQHPVHEALSSLAHLFPLSANTSHLIAPVFQIHSRLQVSLLATLSLHFGLNPNRFLPSISSCALNCLSHIQSALLKPGHWILAYGGIIHGAPSDRPLICLG